MRRLLHEEIHTWILKKYVVVINFSIQLTATKLQPKLNGNSLLTIRWVTYTSGFYWRHYHGVTIFVK